MPGPAVRQPERILASTARRARETAELVVAALPRPVAIEADEALYLAAPGGILRVLEAQAQGPDALLVVGHNPGMGDLAGHLAWNGEPEVLRALAGGLGTATLVEFEFEIDAWNELDGALGRLVAVVRHNVQSKERILPALSCKLSL